jgi:azurin
MMGAIGLVALLSLSACGGGNNSGTSNAIEGRTAATAGDQGTNNTGSSAGEGSGTVGGSGTGDGTGSDATTTTTDQTATTELVISIANNPNQPRYQQGVMQAPVGIEFVVNYNNPGQEEHNWVLVEPGQEQAVADAAGAKGGDASGVAGVIAWSEPIAASSTTIKVPALPQQGGYPYICTLPGHFAAGHKGALNVR